MARLLAGAWRPDVQPASLSNSELELVLRLLLSNGTAGLAWRRIRGTALAATQGGRKLQQARLSLAADAVIRESHVEHLFAPNSLSVVDPILVKGWAHARLYPEPAMRPYGDIDVLILPERYERALSAQAAIPPVDPQSVVPVDLQTEWVDLTDRTWGEILARSSVVPLRDSRVRILGPEDALRLACYHLLRHAIELAPRGTPLWLCDISVMLENLPPDFDWDYCLAGERRRTQWIAAVIRLANQVLGAGVDRCPGGSLPASVPSWMEKTFLRLWGQRDAGPRLLPLPLRRDIREVPRALTERWPSPLQSVYRLSWPINRVPGRLAQVVDYTARALTWGPRQVAKHPGGATVG